MSDAWTIVGTSASLIGLLFSILAWIRAGKAREAADGARTAIRNRITIEQLHERVASANQLAIKAIARTKPPYDIKFTSGLASEMAAITERMQVVIDVDLSFRLQSEALNDVRLAFAEARPDENTARKAISVLGLLERRLEVLIEKGKYE